jgi:putative sigma-54 modulation protein
MYSSIDLAGARIERQVRKWKDKIRDHKPHGGPGMSIRESVIEAEGVEPPSAAKTAQLNIEAAAGRPSGREARETDVVAPAAPAIKVVKEQTFTVRIMRVDDAVMQMHLLENDFFVFLDVDTKAVSVVYRRKDGNYGLIETGGRLPG